MDRDRTTVVPWLHVAAAAGLAISYGALPDWAAAVTFWPSWLWCAALLTATLACGGWRLPRRAWGRILLVWAIFAAIWAPDVRTLILPMPARPARGEPLRVVSLNCAGGDIAAAREAMEQRPDIVLLQESPETDALRALSREYYGHDAVVAGPDCTVLARVAARPYGRTNLHSATAMALFPGRRGVSVASVRLTPPALRFEFWTPSARRLAAEGRTSHAAELVGDVGPFGGPIIIGGDLNEPAHEAGLRPLRRNGYRDSFLIAGRGWGATVLNDIPVSRFDQIWYRPGCGLRPVRVRAVETKHSDHRMVVADLVWE